MGTQRVCSISALAASLLAAFACGTSPTQSAASCHGTVAVATELPTTGADTSDGVAAQDAAELAVVQANDGHLLGGCAVDLFTRDDASVALGRHDPNLGAINMTALAANQRIVGVVGPLHSNVCASEMPLANTAGLVQVSPGCTSAALTQRGSAELSQSQTSALQPNGVQTFFRVCTTDLVEASRAAQEAEALGASTAYVIGDTESEGFTTAFEQDFARSGGTLVGAAQPAPTAADLAQSVRTAAGLGANLIVFGGTSSQEAAQVRTNMQSAGLSKAIFVAADSVVDTEFLTAAGSAADGAYGVTASPDAAKLPSAAAFDAAYRAAYISPPGAYSASAYDAMNIVLTAIKDAITANGGSLPESLQSFRASVRNYVAMIAYGGATGEISFNKNGDVRSAVVTVWRVQDGGWASIRTFSGTP